MEKAEGNKMSGKVTLGTMPAGLLRVVQK